MDRNSIIGFVIMIGLLVGWSYFTRPSEEEMARQKRLRDSLEQVKLQKKAEQQAVVEPRETATTDSTETVSENDSVANAQLKDKFGAFASAGAGKAEKITLENDRLKVIFSTKGAKPVSVQLKNYHRLDSSELVLFNETGNEFGLSFFANNRAIVTNDMFFKLVEVGTSFDATTNAQLLRFRLSAGEGKYIEYEYSMLPESFLLGYRINFVGMDDVVDFRRTGLDLKWSIVGNSLERGDSWEKDNCDLHYKFYQDEVDNLGERQDNDEETLGTRVKWIGFKQQFFSSILIAEDYIDEATVSYKRTPEEDTKHVLNYKADMALSMPEKVEDGIPFQFYFGPNKFTELKSIHIKEDDNLSMEKIIPYFGFGIGIINRYAIIPLFTFLSSFEMSMGIIILLMTIIIKLVLFPFTYKSYVSMAEMRALKPEIDKINEKIPQDKAMERQQATMALYKKAGVSPLGGCLPMLLQFPILIAMFRFFPASIELRGESFLWATDLSTYDVLFNLPFTIPFYGAHVSGFTLLMTLSSVLTMKFSNQQMTTSNQMPGMQTMMYMMPVMFMVWFNSYSSGLSYYYFLSNIITFGQTMLIRHFIDENKILARLEQKKKKPTKKSKFQERLEQMAKQQQQNKKRK